MMDKIVVVGVSVLCVLGIITIPQYIDSMEGTIVRAVQGYVFWTIVGSLLAVLVGVLKLFGFEVER